MDKLKAKQMRKIARENLKGHWTKSILVFLLYIAIIAISGVIQYYLSHIVFAIIIIVIIIPLKLGLIAFFVKQTYKNTHFCAIFSMFNKKQWPRSIGLNIVFEIGAIIASIPLIIVSIIGVVLFIEEVFTGIQEIITNTSLSDISGLGILAFMIAIIICFIPIVLYSYTYSMVFLIFVDENNGIDKIFASLKESRRIMRGNKWRFFCFQFSYIGWIILSSITLGIGYIWLTPYMLQGIAVFYNEIKDRDKDIENKDEKIEKEEVEIVAF
ncbi:MAG: DUF975 family protein [Sarcina sp.]